MTSGCRIVGTCTAVRNLYGGGIEQRNSNGQLTSAWSRTPECAQGGPLLIKQ
jgi:hypothetical protein